MSYVSVYPAAHNATYVVASDSYSGYYPYSATDPALSLTGEQSGANSWSSDGGGATTPHRINIDYTTAFVAKKFCLENNHNSGTLTDRGIKDFKIYGSNSATAFSTTDPTTLTDLTLLGTFLADAHVASNLADPQYFSITNSTAYRYYVVIPSSTHGNIYMGIRHMEFQKAEFETTDRHIPSFANIPKPYNHNFMPGLNTAGLIRQTRKGFSKAF